MILQHEIRSFEEFTGQKLPTHKVVCPSCQGEGKSSRYLGAYTQSEMEEAGDDFRHDYMAGHYDRTCEECDGLRVTDEVDETYLPGDLKAEWLEWLTEAYESDDIQRQERAMGA